MAQSNKRLVERVNRIRIVNLSLRIDKLAVRINLNPRLFGRIFGCKTRKTRVIPLHWRARIVAAHRAQSIHHFIRRQNMRLFDKLMIHIHGFQIAILAQISEIRVRHAKLFTLINVGSSPMHMSKQTESFRGQNSHFLGRIVSPAAYDSRLIMIVNKQTRPAFLRDRSLI